MTTASPEPVGAGNPAPEPIPLDRAYRDHNGRIWVVSGGGAAGPRLMYLAGWTHGIAVDVKAMTPLADLGPRPVTTEEQA